MIQKEKKLTRRQLLLATSAFASGSILAGCSKNGGDSYYYDGGANNSDDNELIIPADEKLYPGCMGDNCGSKCLVFAHVRNGVIKRFTTDERPDRLYNDSTGRYDPQQRACLKCRGKKSMIYSPSRLLYPLKQTKERGDVTGFVRISWKEAFKEIADKLLKIKDTPYPATGLDPYFKDAANIDRWGKGTLWAVPGTGEATVYQGSSALENLFKTIGGNVSYRGAMLSYPGLDHISRFCADTSTWAVNINSRIDIMNAESAVLWGFNPADSTFGSDTSLLIRTARDNGLPITVVDHQVTRISKMLGADHIAPIGGTDSALVFAMLHHLVNKQIDDPTGNWLDFNKIKDTVHGFFDLPTPTNADFYSHAQPSASSRPQYDPIADDPTTTWRTPENDDPAKYRVPAGASVSAYIFGSDDKLVTQGLNSATSVYPETIGYNVNSASESPIGVADELYNKRTMIYGQQPKTPEWAEMITGIPAQKIRDFAEMCAKTKPTFWMGFGMNRSVENEQPVWAVFTLAMVLGCFGLPGKSFGIFTYSEDFSVYVPSMIKHTTSKIDDAAKIDNQIINFHRMNDDKFSFTNTAMMKNSSDQYVRYTKSTAQTCSWMDMIENGGTGKSRWNNPEVKYCPPLKAMYIIGGNPVNQCGDNALSMDILKQKDPDNTNEYKLKLLVTQDLFMTSTAQYSDYVLPAVYQFEKENMVMGSDGGSNLLYVSKAIDGPGESMEDTRIIEGIAGEMSADVKKDIMNNLSVSDYVKKGYEALAAMIGPSAMSFDEFKKVGIINFNPQRGDDLISPLFKAFRQHLANPTTGAPLNTTSGKFEAYCQGLVEDYEARRFYNFDNDASRYSGYSASDIRLVGSTEGIYTKSCEYSNNNDDNPFNYTNNGGVYKFNPAVATTAEMDDNMKSARFVYPIPMYIPLFEGHHACDNKNQNDYPTASGYPNIDYMTHPDPLNLKTTYQYCMSNYHSIYRAHSTSNMNPYVNETYKRGVDGELTYPKAGTNFDDLKEGKGVSPWPFGAFDPIEISKIDADAQGIKTGDMLLVSSPRGVIIAAADVTAGSRKGTARMPEGAWTTFKECEVTLADGSLRTLTVDIGGSTNTLTTQRPSRICQGSSYGTYQRIKIEKIKSVKLV